MCPLALPVAAAMERFTADAVHNGSTNWRDWGAAREAVRHDAATLLGCTADEVALTTSTSQGLITVAEGVALEPGDEILVVQDDFPANQIPWFRQERRGARVVVVPRPAGDDGVRRVSTEAILERVTERTRVVALPWVLFDTGQRLDLGRVGAALADHPALFCVDAIQGLGAFPMDMAALGIDVLSADSHKWMLGLEGAGLFACRAELLDRLDGPFQSWLSVVDPFGPYAPGKALLPSARRFEYAALPTIAVYGLGAALRLLLDTGLEAISGRILELTAQLGAGLEARGWQLLSDLSDPARRSGVVSARPPGLTAEAANEQLEARQVSVAARGGGVRFSPHAWNSPDEMDAVLERLP